MKNAIKLLAFTLFILTFYSCSNDETSTDLSGNGNLVLKFDNIYNLNDFAFNTPYTNSNGEVIKANKLKYIVSNIRLTKEDGSLFIIPKSESLFIVNEANSESTFINLQNIPAANYTGVTFGIGVDQAQFSTGADGQGNFLALAQTENMLWSWAAGYKFLVFEGVFTTATNSTESPFRIHTGQTSVSYNYTEKQLDLTTKALVRQTITPQIHIMADFKYILDGANKNDLANANGGDIMGGAKLTDISNNIPDMFSVHHVHND